MEKTPVPNPEVSNDKSRSKQAERVLAFLERINAYEYVQNIIEGKEKKPTFDDFRDFLVRVNGMARGIPTSSRSADGVAVGLKGFVESINVPKHEDKEELLRYAYDRMEEIEKDDIKYMIPAVINAVHLFNDGNGRTSRVMYQLLDKHGSKEEFEIGLRLALGDDGRWDAINVNPGLISLEIQHILLQKYGWEFDSKDKLCATQIGNIKTFVATIEIAELDEKHPNYTLAKNFFAIYKNDAEYLLTAFHSVIGENRISGMLTDEYEIKGRVSPFKMLGEITVEEWQKITEAYFEFKKEHVKTIVDCFRKPDDYRVAYYKETNLRDYFVNKVKENYEKFN